MKLFSKKQYFRYRYNNAGQFIEAEYIKADGTFGHDYLTSGKPLGLFGERLINVIVNNHYNWVKIKK